jgi:hypothetical protein
MSTPSDDIIRPVSDAEEEPGVSGWLDRHFRRWFHTPDHPDRGFYRAVAAIFGLGLFSSAVGLAAVVAPSGDVPDVSQLRLGAGLLVGPMFMVFGLAALVRRWRQGPQPPGRHTQD